jgi:hypothetical protein
MADTDGWGVLAENAPVALLVHAALARTVTPEAVERTFAEHAGAAYTHKLTMSTLVDLVLQVVAGRKRSVFHAFRDARDVDGVTSQAFYSKLARVPPEFACALVADSARRLRPVVERLRPPRADGPTAGYRVRILDGTQPDGSEHRLGPLRRVAACGLPCRVVVCYDPETGLCEAAAAAEDAYEAEPALALRLLERAAPGDLYVADRAYSLGHLFGAAGARGAHLLAREHRGQARIDERGPLAPAGRCPTGAVFEQPVAVHDAHRRLSHRLRRIVVRLDEPTEGGDTEVALLTGLPDDVPAAELAELYRRRWRIESEFAFLKCHLNGEIPALGEPRAAILVLCLAMVASNAVASVRAALAAGHPGEDPGGLSGYYLAAEVAESRRAVELFVPASTWREVASEGDAAFARRCLGLARGADWDRYRTTPRGPRRPPPPRASGKDRHHYSTYRLKQEAKEPRKRC